MTNVRYFGALCALAVLISSLPLVAQTNSASVCDDCIRKNLDYLAGPELHGRGSGTEDEHHAAAYIAARLKSYGLAPAAENGEYIQTGTIQTRKVIGKPAVTMMNPASPITLTQGKELAFYSVSQPDVSAPLQKLDLNDPKVSPESVKPGAAVLLKVKADGSSPSKTFLAFAMSKAALVLVPASPGNDARFQRALDRGPQPEMALGDQPPRPDAAMLAHDAGEKLWSVPEGTVLKLHAEVSPWQAMHTWNVLAKLEGTTRPHEIILLSAHLDHLGVRDGKTYPGADDDGSGSVAVMELARALAQQPRPQRTIVFALFGSEELGLLGSKYFLEHPPFPLHQLVANLNFEMIGRADDKVKPDELWLTGWPRTNLGPELAARGAQLVADPHPEQNFFARSDNYALAQDGIVAQTISSYGLHKDYHQPTDTLDRIDWQHLDSAIGSMIAPVSWLANSDFTPQWSAGGKP